MTDSNDENRTTKYVTLVVQAVFHGDYFDVDEVSGRLVDWVDRGFEDRDDLKSWATYEAGVREVAGDPEGYDS